MGRRQTGFWPRYAAAAAIGTLGAVAGVYVARVSAVTTSLGAAEELVRNGRHDEAFRSMQRAARWAAVHPVLTHRLRCLAIEAHLGQGEVDEALGCIQRSLALAQEQEMRLEEGTAYRVLGQVHLARQELAQAEQALQKSLHILQELNSRYEIGKTLFQLARLHRIQGDQAQMWENLRQALTIFEDLGARLDLAQAQELTPE